MSFPSYPAYKDSGVAWLGEVPGHWEVRPLKHLARLQTGMTPPTDEWDNYTEEEGFQWVRPEDIDETGAPTKSSKFLTNKGWMQTRKIRAGASLICCIGTIGKVGITADAVSTNQQITAAEPREDSRYLFYALCAGRVELELASTGNVLRILNTERLGNISGPNPPFGEQTQIAAFLDRETTKIDALVAEQRRLMALLKEKRQAVISHAVTRGLNPHVPMKPSGIEWLGDVPEHWEVKPMRMIANVVRGASPRPAGDPRYFGGDAVPWVTVGEITKDDYVYLTETEFFLTEEGATHSNLFKSGTLIYSNSGATLGVPKVLSIDACANDGVVAFLNLDVRVRADFLYHYLASITESIREKVKQGSGQPNLNTDIVKDLRFGLPPLPEQEQIVARITALANEFRTLTTEAQRAIALLQERRTALISAAVTGQIDVRSAA